MLPVLVLGQKSAARFCPTHLVFVRPGLAVAVAGYPWDYLHAKKIDHVIAYG